ncbi:MAG: hypothetical protein ABIX28_03500, partial [Vicinamibacterales bacterium]
MPPRHVYWTIILEGKPTAFRAHTREELQPTFKQLSSKHADIQMKWFARGRLWESPDEEKDLSTRGPGSERRAASWRPGGKHEDPRERFKIPRDEKRRRFAERLHRGRPDDERAPAEGGEGQAPPDAVMPPADGGREAREQAPVRNDAPEQPVSPAGGDGPEPKRPSGPRGEGSGPSARVDRDDRPRDRERQPYSDRPRGDGRPSGDRPWSPRPKPFGDRGDRPSGPPRDGGARGGWEKKPWDRKPGPAEPRGGDDRPSGARPSGPRDGGGEGPRGPAGGDRERKPYSDRPRGEGRPSGDRPWSPRPKPYGDRGDRPSGPPRGGGGGGWEKKPWERKPGPRGGDDRPTGGRPAGPRGDGGDAPRGDRERKP